MRSGRTGLRVLGSFCFLVGIHIVAADQKSDLEALTKNYGYADLSPVADVLKRARQWALADKKNIVKKAMNITDQKLELPEEFTKGIEDIAKTIGQIEAVLRAGNLCQKKGCNMVASKVLDTSGFERGEALETEAPEIPVGSPEDMDSYESPEDAARDKPIDREDDGVDIDAILFQNVSYSGNTCSAAESEESSMQMWYGMPVDLSDMLDLEASAVLKVFIGFHSKLLCGSTELSTGMGLIMSFKDVMQFVSAVASQADVKNLGATDEKGNALVTLYGIADSEGTVKGRLRKAQLRKVPARKAALRRAPARKRTLALRKAAVRKILGRQVPDGGDLDVVEDGLQVGLNGLPPELKFCMYIYREDVASIVEKMTAFFNKFIDSMQESFKK